MSITEPGLVHDLPEMAYHADPVEAGSLSSTMAKLILKSPAHLRHYLDTPRESKAAFDFGSVVHGLVLGKGWDVAALDYDSWRTKEAREARAEVEAQGKIALLQKDYAEAQAVADAVKGHPAAAKLFKRGDAEVSAFGQHDSGVWLRGRFDWLVSGIIVDLKTVRSADPRRFNRTTFDFGYEIQAAHYRETHRLATGEYPRDFIHVLVEKEPPYAVSVVRLDAQFLDAGHQRLETAIARYRHATETGEWPGYPTSIQTIEPIPYMTYHEEDDQ